MRRKSVRNGTVKIPLGLLFGFIDEEEGMKGIFLQNETPDCSQFQFHLSFIYYD